MKKPDGGAVLLTEDQVLEWRNEREAVAKHIEKLTARADELDRLLGAADLFARMPKTIRIEPSDRDDGPPDYDDESMADAAKRLLREEHRPLLNQEMIAKLRTIPRFKTTLDKNPGYYYTMINRVIKRGDIIKYRKKLKLPNWDASKEKGSEAEATEPL